MIVLWVIQQSHTIAGFLNKVRVPGQIPLNTFQWGRWHSDQGYFVRTFQDSAIEALRAVDLCWFLTWLVVQCHVSSSVKILKEKKEKNILKDQLWVICSLTTKTKTKSTDVPLEQLPHAPQVRVRRWQVTVLQLALSEEMASSVGTRIELIWTEATTNVSQLLQLPCAKHAVFFMPEGTWCFWDQGMHDCWCTHADSLGFSLLVSSQGWGSWGRRDGWP